MLQRLCNSYEGSNKNALLMGSTKDKDNIPIFANFANEFYGLNIHYTFTTDTNSWSNFIAKVSYESLILSRNTGRLSKVENLYYKKGIMFQVINDKVLLHWMVTQNKEGLNRIYVSSELMYSEEFKLFKRSFDKKVLIPLVVEHLLPLIILNSEDLTNVFFEPVTTPKIKSLEELKTTEDTLTNQVWHTV
jgi:hypothetical protein